MSRQATKMPRSWAYAGNQANPEGGFVRGTWLEARLEAEERLVMTKRSAFKYLKLSSEIIRLAVKLYVGSCQSNSA